MDTSKDRIFYEVFERDEWKTNLVVHSKSKNASPSLRTKAAETIAYINRKLAAIIMGSNPVTSLGEPYNWAKLVPPNTSLVLLEISPNGKTAALLTPTALQIRHRDSEYAEKICSIDLKIVLPSLSVESPSIDLINYPNCKLTWSPDSVVFSVYDAYTAGIFDIHGKLLHSVSLNDKPCDNEPIAPIVPVKLFILPQLSIGYCLLLINHDLQLSVYNVLSPTTSVDGIEKIHSISLNPYFQYITDAVFNDATNTLYLSGLSTMQATPVHNLLAFKLANAHLEIPSMLPELQLLSDATHKPTHLLNRESKLIQNTSRRSKNALLNPLNIVSQLIPSPEYAYMLVLFFDGKIAQLDLITNNLAYSTNDFTKFKYNHKRTAYNDNTYSPSNLVRFIASVCPLQQLSDPVHCFLKQALFHELQSHELPKPVKIQWWSEVSVVVFLNSGDLYIIKPPSMQNILGELPEQFNTSMTITGSGYNASLLAVETHIDMNLTNRNKLLSGQYQFILSAKFHLLHIKQVKAEEIAKIMESNGEYSEALEFSKVFNLNTDQLYLAMAQSQIQSDESDIFDSVTKCLDNIDNKLIVLNFILDCNIIASVRASIYSRLFDYGKTLGFTELSKNQVNTLKKTSKISNCIQRLDIKSKYLQIYTELISSDTSGLIDGQNIKTTWASFMSWDVLRMAAELAFTTNLTALSRAYTLFYAELAPYAFLLLSFIPESVNPKKYFFLIPIMNNSNAAHHDKSKLHNQPPSTNNNESANSLAKDLMNKGDFYKTYNNMIPTDTKGIHEYHEDAIRARSLAIATKTGILDYAINLLHHAISIKQYINLNNTFRYLALKRSLLIDHGFLQSSVGVLDNITSIEATYEDLIVEMYTPLLSDSSFPTILNHTLDDIMKYIVQVSGEVGIPTDEITSNSANVKSTVIVIYLLKYKSTPPVELVTQFHSENNNLDIIITMMKKLTSIIKSYVKHKTVRFPVTMSELILASKNKLISNIASQSITYLKEQQQENAISTTLSDINYQLTLISLNTTIVLEKYEIFNFIVPINDELEFITCLLKQGFKIADTIFSSQVDPLSHTIVDVVSKGLIDACSLFDGINKMSGRSTSDDTYKLVNYFLIHMINSGNPYCISNIKMIVSHVDEQLRILEDKATIRLLSQKASYYYHKRATHIADSFYLCAYSCAVLSYKHSPSSQSILNSCTIGDSLLSLKLKVKLSDLASAQSDYAALIPVLISANSDKYSDYPMWCKTRTHLKLPLNNYLLLCLINHTILEVKDYVVGMKYCKEILSSENGSIPDKNAIERLFIDLAKGISTDANNYKTCGRADLLLMIYNYCIYYGSSDGLEESLEGLARLKKEHAQSKSKIYDVNKGISIETFQLQHDVNMDHAFYMTSLPVLSKGNTRLHGYSPQAITKNGNDHSLSSHTTMPKSGVIAPSSFTSIFDKIDDQRIAETSPLITSAKSHKDRMLNKGVNLMKKIMFAPDKDQSTAFPVLYNPPPPTAPPLVVYNQEPDEVPFQREALLYSISPRDSINTLETLFGTCRDKQELFDYFTVYLGMNKENGVEKIDNYCKTHNLEPIHKSTNTTAQMKYPPLVTVDNQGKTDDVDDDFVDF